MVSLPPQYENWPTFNEQQGRRPVRGLCTKLTDIAGDGAGQLALDLGAGAGIETRHLLEKNWRVLAIDSAENSPTLIRQAAGNLADELTVLSSSFEDIQELPMLDLIYSGYALPFCPPSIFAKLWELLVSSLTTDGLLAVNLFGERDEWNPNPGMSFVSKAQIDELLTGFELIYAKEEEGEKPAFSGPKYWHTFDVIARKLG